MLPLPPILKDDEVEPMNTPLEVLAGNTTGPLIAINFPLRLTLPFVNCVDCAKAPLKARLDPRVSV